MYKTFGQKLIADLKKNVQVFIEVNFIVKILVMLERFKKIEIVFTL